MASYFLIHTPYKSYRPKLHTAKCLESAWFRLEILMGANAIHSLVPLSLYHLLVCYQTIMGMQIWQVQNVGK